MAEENAEPNNAEELENKLQLDKSKSEEKKSEESRTETISNDHIEHIRYETDGSAIYTDPKTKYQYKWCTKECLWKPMEQNCFTAVDQKSENPETEYYRWDSKKNEWVLKNPISSDVAGPSSSSNDNKQYPIYGIDDEGQHIYTDRDGAVFFWDVERNAWFPKIDEDFMARYQMSYGFIDNTTPATISGTSNNTNSSKDSSNIIKSNSTLSANPSQAPKRLNENDDDVNTKSTEQKRKRGGPSEPPSIFIIFSIKINEY